MSFNNTSDEYWAEKLRRENCDQFNTLVRMHLSFVLDLNTDDTDCITEKTKFKKWSFVPFVKKTKCPSRGVMDGAPLTQEGICQVYQLIEYLGKEPNICAEGIFRRTGSLSRQQELRALLNQGQSLNLDGGRYSVHDCASVLKGFLAELPEPLLTDAHYPAHCQIAELCKNNNSNPQPVQQQPSATETRLLRSVQLLLLLLPTENRVLLRDVLQLLNETAARQPNNKMSADSLATLFTPHLLCPRRLSPEALHADSQSLAGIVAFMIRKGVSLFEIPPKLAVDIRSYFTSASGEKSPGPAASTVYSFVDRERTARAHATDPTETALAQLYAYIQGLPESSKKRKLVKQFNRQNGNGTPLQLHPGSALRSKSLGDSIKRHIFFSSKPLKTRPDPGRVRSSSEEVLSETMMTPRSRKPVLLMSGTNVCALPKLDLLKQPSNSCDSFNEEEDLETSPIIDQSSILSQSRSILSAESPVDESFSSRTDDYGYSCNSDDESKLFCLTNDENVPPRRDDFSLSERNYSSSKRPSSPGSCDNAMKRRLGDKEPILKPKQYNSDGEAVVYETSF